MNNDSASADFFPYMVDEPASPVRNDLLLWVVCFEHVI